MATIKVINIIKRAERIIQDTTNTRWPKAEWLDWYNDATLAVVNIRPDAHVVNGTLSLTPNSSKQAIQSDGLKLIDVLSNTSSGKVIRKIPRRQLDDQIDGWHKTQGTDVQHYVYDDRDPKHFYIFPQPTTAHDVEYVYATAPVNADITDFDNDTSVMALDDSYLNAILDYMLHRAYSKDADYAENASRSQQHLNQFERALGAKTQADMAVSPVNNDAGSDNARRG